MLTVSFLASVGLFFGFVLSLSFAAYCLRHRKVRGALSLSVFFIGISLWVLADLIQVQTSATATPPVGTELRLLGPDITVVGLLLFSLEYAGRDTLLTLKTYVVLTIKPLLTTAVLFSPFREQLVVTPVADGLQFGYQFASTPLYIGYTGYNWILTVLALAVLLHMLFRTVTSYRQQIILMLVAITVPFIFNILYHVDVLAFDFTSSAFLLTATIFTVATFRLRLLSTLPVARRTVLEEMEEMVFVLDDSKTVITVNAAAREYFDTDEPLTGKPVTAVLGEQSHSVIEGDDEGLVFDIGDGHRYFNIASSTVTDVGGDLLAHVLVCRDVTGQKQSEAKLRNREQDLSLLKDLQSRVLRHNLRNELNVIQLNASFLADEEEPEQNEQYEEIIEKTDQLLEIGAETRAIEQLMEQNELETHDAVSTVETAVDSLRAEYPDVHFSLSVPDRAAIRAVPQVDQAIENLVDNAARHNTADQPHVQVSVERDEDTVRIRVADNGPGLDDEELGVIGDHPDISAEGSGGFGLRVVYWVVKKSGGDLSVTVDDGTTVELVFDAAEA